jgi:ribosome maturation factor RimP
MGGQDEVERLCAPIVARAGLELVDVEVRPGLLRISVDGADGVGVEDLTGISRQLSSALDAEDPMPGHYELEVSSPGLERPLRRPEHFQRFVGAEIAIKTRPDAEGERRANGRIVEADDDGVTIAGDGLEGGSRRFRYDEIERARTVFDWKLALAADRRRPGRERAARRASGAEVAQR